MIRRPFSIQEIDPLIKLELSSMTSYKKILETYMLSYIERKLIFLVR